VWLCACSARKNPHSIENALGAEKHPLLVQSGTLVGCRDGRRGSGVALGIGRV
jgi:hypothetical protein